MSDNRIVVEIAAQDNLSGALKHIESGLIRFVGAVSSALSAISVIGFPVAAAARFQTELLQAAKTTGYTAEQTKVLGEELVNLSRTSNVAATDLAKIATMGGQLGIGSNGDVQALTFFTEEISRAVTALDISAEEASTSFGKLINIFNIPADQFRNAISAMNQVSNASSSSATELFDVTRRIGNLGGSVDFAQATALSAAMIDLGMTAETAGTTVTKIFADMKSKAADFATFVGVSTRDWINVVSHDGIKALDMYVDALNRRPVEKAAETKVELTGGGRIFEAVTKLQEQRSRAIELQKQAQAAQLEAERLSTTGADPKVIDTQRQIAASMKEMATNASVVDRLLVEARDGYRTGASAAREQAVVMSGLTAQWDRFKNNVVAVGKAAGDELLPALTNVLRSFSDGLGTKKVEQQMREAAAGIVEVTRRIVDMTQAIAGSNGAAGSGINWGAALNLAALLVAGAAVKGVIGLFSILGSTAARQIPMLGGLSRALFGTKVEVDANGNAIQEATRQYIRQGGALNTISNAFGRASANLQRLPAATTALANAQAKLTAAQFEGGMIAAHLTATQQRMGVMLQQLGPRLQTVANFNDAITAAEQRRDAATRAGNTRSAAGFQGRITVLTRQRDAMIALARQEERIQAAQQRSNARIADANAEIAAQTANVRTLNSAWTRTAAAISNGVVGAVGKVGAAGRAISNEVRTITAMQVAGASAPAAIASRFIAAEAAIKGFAGRASTALRNFATQASVAVSSITMNGIGPSLAGGIASAMAGVRSAISRTFNQPVGKSLSTAISSITSGIGPLLRRIGGIEEAWAAATPGVARNALVMQGAINAVGKAVGLLKAGMFGLISGVFVLQAIREALDFFGLWDGVTKTVAGIAKFFGVSEKSLPAFLRTKEAAAALDDELKTTAEDYERLASAASKFDQAARTRVTAAAQKPQADKDLTFNPEKPNDAAKNVTETLAAVAAGYSRIEQIQAAMAQKQRDLNLAIRDMNRLKEVIAPGETSTAAPAKVDVENYENAVAKVNALQKEMKSLESANVTAKLSIAALDNTTTHWLSGGEAQSLLAAKNGTSAMLAWANALKVQEDAVRASNKAQAEQTKLASGGNGSTAQQLAQANAAVTATAEAAATATDNVNKLFDAMMSSGRASSLLREQMNALASGKNASAVVDIAKRLQEAFAKGTLQFKGDALQEIKPDTLMKAGSALLVNSRLRDAYAGTASFAKNEAEQAARSVDRTLTEVHNRANELRIFVDKLSQLARSAKDKAAANIKTRAIDVDSGKRNRDLDQQLEREKKIAEQRLKTQAAEGDYNHPAPSGVLQQRLLEQKVMNEIDDKYAKLKQDEQDRANIAKAKVGLQQEVADFDKLVTKTAQYKKELQDANAVLNSTDSKVTPDDRAQAVEKRNRAIAKLTNTYNQLQQAAEKYASTEPIGSTNLIDQGVLDKMAGEIGSLEGQISGATLEAAKNVETTWKTYANTYEALSKQMGTNVEQLTRQFNTLAEQTGVSQKAAIDNFAAAASSSDTYLKALERLQKAQTQMVVSPGSVTPEMIKALETSLTDATKTLKVPVTLNADPSAMVASLQKALDVTAVPLKFQPIDAQVNPNLNPEGADKIRNQMTEALKNIAVDVNANVKISTKQRDGGYIPAFADGGAVGSVQHFDGGGRVLGAGTSRSDSIDAKLSHGEFVMDAFTTRIFGPAFFYRLMKLARGTGNVVNNLRQFSPMAFAGGGFVARSAPRLDFANDFKFGMAEAADTTDKIEINLNSGGRRATVVADRRQAKEFVDMLKTFK